jgi:hypothetical protein
MSVSKQLPSGATLEMTMAGLEDANDLLEATMRELESVALRLGIKVQDGQDLIVSLFSGELGEEAIDTLKNILARLIASKEVKAALWKCARRTTLDRVLVTIDLFEDEEKRVDYLPMLKEVLVFNLSPFIKSLKYLLSGLSKATV